MTIDEMLAQAAYKPAWERALPPTPTRSQQIAAHLIRDNGAAPHAADKLAAIIEARMFWGENGQTAIIGLDGHADPDMTVWDLLAELRGAHSEMFLPKEAEAEAGDA